MDETGAQADDFDYIYYPGTNKLRYLYPITRTKEYDDVITQDNKVYSHIILYKDAYVPEGQSVTIKAIDSIDVEITDEEEFSTIGHGELHAYVLGDDEGAYNYDAIGNLIWDQDLGVQIEWNAYGKVRKVNKSDSTVMTFRYDAAGNRIEKMIITAEQDTSVTRYVRDASGNVMAIYKADSLTEVPIYGSSRIGLYRGGIATGRQMLGHKQYELSNHLGNVLTVTTDNARLDADSTWATVVSAGDYYAFGSSMPGREFSDDGYRYGFNGKEKDDDGEWGSTAYDYGFRIYNPEIGKFLSVDPLTGGYPMLTPYQFASNKPINGIDLDGLEWVLRIHSPKISAELSEAIKSGNIIEQRRLTYWALNNHFPDRWAANKAYHYEVIMTNKAGSLTKDPLAEDGLTVYLYSFEDSHGIMTRDPERAAAISLSDEIHFDFDRSANLAPDWLMPVDLNLWDNNNSATGDSYYKNADFMGVYGESLILGNGNGVMAGRLRGYGYLEFGYSVEGRKTSLDIVTTGISIGKYSGAGATVGSPLGSLESFLGRGFLNPNSSDWKSLDGTWKGVSPGLSWNEYDKFNPSVGTTLELDTRILSQFTKSTKQNGTIRNWRSTGSDASIKD